MTLSPRVGGIASKPVDVSPSPASQRYASPDCWTSKMTYEFFNELIEIFTFAQTSYAVTNVPNDPNALKKLLDKVRTGGYDFTVGAMVANSVSTNTIVERLAGVGVTVDGVLLKDGDGTFTGGGVIIQHSSNPFQEYHVTGGDSGYNKVHTSCTGTGFNFQTRDNAGGFVSNDYLIGRNASGATSHSWRIGDVEKLHLDITGLTIADNLYTDDILEGTSGHGVEIDGILLKDGNVAFDSGVGSISFALDRFNFVASGTVNNAELRFSEAICNSMNISGAILSAQGQVASTWCYFDGTGTPTIYDNYNVSSITDLGTGQYRLNFTNALPNNEYIVHANISQVGFVYPASRNTTSVTIHTRVYGTDLADMDKVSVTILAKQ